MTLKVGINGFGRIGRNFLRAAKQSGADIDIVAPFMCRQWAGQAAQRVGLEKRIVWAGG